VAPEKPAQLYDPSSPVPKVAALLGLRSASKLWRECVDDREKLEKAAADVVVLSAIATRAREAMELAKCAHDDANKKLAAAQQETERVELSAAVKATKSAFGTAVTALKEADAAVGGRTAADPWLPADRSTRKDAFSPELRALIEKEWHDETAPDPSERAVRRQRVGRGQYIYHQAHQQFKKTYDMLSSFLSKHPHIKCSRGMWQLFKPFYVIRQKQNTCECRYCENMRQFHKALVTNRNVFDCLSIDRVRAAKVLQAWFRKQPTPDRRSRIVFKRDQISVFDDLAQCDKKSDLLRCVCCPLAVDAHRAQDGRKIDARCDRKHHVGSTARSDRSSQSLKCMGCHEGACEECGENRRVYRNQATEEHFWGPVAAPKQTITYHSYRSEEDEDGNVHSDNNLNQHKAHPSKFLDEYFVALNQYKSHYHTLCRQKAAHLQQERNFKPHQLLFDMDFAENFTIILGLEIQSAHWISKQVLTTSPMLQEFIGF
jgi:hypothetical protein